jgi:endonuclease/exonuclease/phosphatase family metal-dependent hydrolase
VRSPCRWIAVSLLLAGGLSLDAAGSFTIATYNVENYLHFDVPGRRGKPPESKARVAETLLALRADIVALQEMGCTNALLELRDRLRAGGLDYAHWEHVAGHDTNIHVAVLSRFPFAARRPHTNDSFLIDGRRFLVSRGIAELDVEVHPRYRFTLLATHLKSKRPVPEANESEMREHEARVLREKVDARLKQSPAANLIVLGDFNDTPNSKPLRALIGRGAHALVDTRPPERGPDAAGSQLRQSGTKGVAWTYHYDRDDTLNRFDYILLSRGMEREWDRARSCVLALPFWDEASDHRPVVVTIIAEDR